MEKISVIIPAYNAGHTIKKSIESIINGEYNNFEIIVINDGSIDDTEKIVQDISDKDKRVILYSQENQGVAAARNAGLKYATGKMIAWCDADDWVEKDWLLNSYKLLKEFNADVVICRCKIGNRVVEHNPEKIEVWNREEAVSKFLEHKELNGSLCNKLFRKELFEKNRFDSSISYFEDDRIFWEILKRIERVVRYHKEEYHITLRENSLTAQKCNQKRIDALKVWETIHHECKMFYSKYQNKSRQALAYQYFSMLLVMYRDNYHDNAVEKRARAVMLKYVLQTINAVEGIIHKAFYIVILFSGRLARIIYNFKN